MTTQVEADSPEANLGQVVTGHTLYKAIEALDEYYGPRISDLEVRASYLAQGLENVSKDLRLPPNVDLILKYRSYDLITKDEARQLLGIDEFLKPVDPPLIQDVETVEHEVDIDVPA